MTPLRSVLEVEDASISRVFDGITHPTNDGTGFLRIRPKGKERVPAAVLLLLGLLHEEAGGSVRANGTVPPEAVQKPKPFLRALPSLDDITFRLPPPPRAVRPKIVTGITERSAAAGRTVVVVFAQLTFDVVGPTRMTCDTAGTPDLRAVPRESDVWVKRPARVRVPRRRRPAA